MIDYTYLRDASSTSRETAFADDHQSAIHLLACNFASVHQSKKIFTGRLGNKFVKKYGY